MIIEQRYQRIYPESVIKLPSRLEVGRSKLAPWIEGEVATISGPLEALKGLLNDFEVHVTIGELRNLSAADSQVEKSATDSKDEDQIVRFIDLHIPGALELVENGKLVEFAGASQGAWTIQSDLKNFARVQEIGVDVGFRCIKCRGCKDCKKGAGLERISIVKEQEQHLIKRSVSVDLENGCAQAVLPFNANPDEAMASN